MKVLIADDHSLIRVGLGIAVREEFPKAEISEAGNASQVLKLLKQTRFSLMLMDIRMPETNSLELLEQLLALQPDLRVLINSLNSETVFATRYLKAGAMGYIEKAGTLAELRKAIRRVAEGGRYVSEKMAEEMTLQLQSGKSADPFAQLAKQEFEIAMHIVNGMDSKSICALMSLQPPTVATHKRRILEKLNLTGTYELIRLADEYGIQ